MMSRCDIPWSRLIPALMLMAVLGAPARAQVLNDNEDLVDEVVVQPVFVMADENFEQWIFREFQNAVVRDLVERTMRAAEELNVPTVLVSGGVAANRQLRATFEERARNAGLNAFFPSHTLSTDNAAMIAAAAYPRFCNQIFADLSLNASASLPLA